MSQTKPPSTLPALSPTEIDALFEAERHQSGVVYDPRSPELRTNPYRLLHTLRTQDPVHWSPFYAAWLLTRYRDAHTFLRQPKLSKDFRNARHNPLGRAGFSAPSRGTPTMLQLDPPDHTRLRSLVSKAFTPQAVETLRPRIQDIADGLLNEVESREPFDLIRDFATPLPAMVMAELLGVSPEDYEQFKAWAIDLAVGSGVFNNADDRARGRTAWAQLRAYFDRVVQERRHHPRDDLVSALLAAQEAGDRLTEGELRLTCIHLLVAGHETTTNLIGNGVLALLNHPDQWQLLQDDPTHIEGAIEEFLRYDSPTQIVQRLVTEEIEVGGQRITPGTMVGILIGAANRDPEVFPNPDVLDITRNGPHHVSFGHGIHYCLGAALARAEGSVAVMSLLRRFPRLRLAAEPPAWRDSITSRGLETLAVAPNR